MSVATNSHFARGRTTMLLRSVVLSILVATRLVACIWAVGGYVRGFPTFFAPQQLLAAIVRDVLQGYGANSVLANGRRCASDQGANVYPLP
jgi:hypothetical protein